MRVAVLGAAGVLGGPLIDALSDDPRRRIDSVVAVARRLPLEPRAGVDWREADLATDDVSAHLEGVDAVVNLSMDAPGALLEAVGQSGAVHLVQISSFAAYAPAAPGHDPVDETWPTDGLADAPLARRAVAVERALDAHLKAHPSMRVVRIRAGVALGPAAAAELRRRLGPLGGYVGSVGRLPVVPGIVGAAVPAVHHDDLAAAAACALTGNAVGAFNVALDDPLELATAARAFGGRPVAIPDDLVRVGAGLADRLFSLVSPASSASSAAGGWLAMARTAPRLATWRARKELGWQPRHPLAEAIAESVTPRS